MVYIKPALPLLMVRQSLDNASWQINLASRDQVHKCARRRINLTLASCQNLAPAGTGTKSLIRALEEVTSRRWKHYHWMRLVPEHPAPCVIMTVRDPAQRLESAFRYELNSSNKHASRHSLFTLRGVASSVREFVEAVRNESHPRHGKALALYRRSVFLPGLFNGNWEPSFLQHENFLVSTVNYLRGLDCRRTELHLICTNRFDAHWRALLHSFGHHSPASSPHLNYRSAVVSPQIATSARLSSADIQYVKWHMFP